MKKLSETWRQRKPVSGAAKPSDAGETTAVTTKRLGRVAIQSSSFKNRCAVSSYSPGTKLKVVQSTAACSTESPGCSFSSSFGVDFDTDLIEAADSLEAAASLTRDIDSGRDRRDGGHGQQTPGRQRRAGGTNAVKRKSTRRSGVGKPSLFGEVSVAEALTPTHSPRNKKRKDSDRSLLGSKNSGLLCPASPSTESGLDHHHHHQHRGMVSGGGGVSPRLSSKRNISRGKDLKNMHFNHTGTLKEEDGGEKIETDVSPVSKHSSEHSSASAHSKQCCNSALPVPSGKLSPKLTSGLTKVKPGYGRELVSSSKTSSFSRSHRVTPPNDALSQGSHMTDKTDVNRNQLSRLRQDKRTTVHGNQSESVSVTAALVSSSPPEAQIAAGSESAIDVERASEAETGGSKASTPPQLAAKGSDVPNSVKSGVGCERKSERCSENTQSGSGSRENAHCSVTSETKTSKGDSNCADNLLTVSENHLTSKIGSQSVDSLLLSSWGLPGPVLEAYHGQGITTMFPWQAECLTTGNVLNGGNLVYSAPTSAGKTMVAELLVLKRVLETRRKALFILPFVSVTREKMLSLQRLYQDAGVRVGGFMGGHSPVGGLHSVDVAVCTIEKGNGLLNRLMEEGRLLELGVVVIDELHMVGDSSRGYLLELLLTKVCYMAHRSKQDSPQGIQVIGMSATLPNLDLLATWLDADLYHTDFRPVPLTQNIKVGTTIYDASMTAVRDLDPKTVFQGDDDHIIPLCLETLMGGHSVLIFCPTKAWCEKMAEKIAREFYGLMKNPTALAAYAGQSGFVKASEMASLPIDQASLRHIVEQLGRCPVGVDPMLGKVIQYAVAYHHAGLTFDERDIVEGAFRQGLVKVLVATSTLSSGVNLPARRVIVRSPLFGGRLMDALSYKQMAGRAGRKGVDTEGECVLVCKEGERKMAQSLLRSELSPVTSCLHSMGDTTALSRSMKRAILEVVVSGVASSPEDVSRYVSCTLLSASLPRHDHSTAQLVTACLEFLQDNEFVTLHTTSHPDHGEVERYQPTQLGSAVLASSMSPDEGLAVFTELQKARQCFVLANELHIIYLVTPIYSQEISASLDWYHYYCLWERLSPDMRLVAGTVGVQEAFLAKAITGRVPSKTPAQMRAVAIHKRFYTALALHELVQERPLLEVAAKYSCNKGQLQSLMQSAATFAGMVTVFCSRLGWSNMELLFSQFQQRLTLGVTRELCDLVRIPLLTGGMARCLFNAGYHTVTAVAHATPEDVETIFRNASPFQSAKQQDGETDWEVAERRKARCVWLVGHRGGVTELEAASAIISEAKALIQQELGVRVQWQSQEQAQAGSSSSQQHQDMSADRTVLGEMQSHTSPPHHQPGCSSNSSVNASGETSPPPAAGKEQAGATTTTTTPTTTSTTTPDCTSSNRLKRKSPGGSAEFQHNTPVSGQQAKRPLSSSSRLRRSLSRSKSQSSRRSPLDHRASEHRHASEQARSPKDASFFGQVVVSPPAALRAERRVSSDAVGSADSSRGHHNNNSKVSPFHVVDTPSRKGHPKLSPIHMAALEETSRGAQKSVTTTTTTSVQRSGEKGAGVVRSPVQSACTDHNDCRVAQPDRSAKQHYHGLEWDNQSTSSDKPNHCGEGFRQGQRQAALMEAGNKVADASSIQQNKVTDVLCTAQGTAAQVPEQPESVPNVPESPPQESNSLPETESVPESECLPQDPDNGVAVVSEEEALPDAGCCDDFDDSLILNTQTDNLLAGHMMNQCPFTGGQSSGTVTASTPLAIQHCARTQLKDSSSKVKDCALRDRPPHRRGDTPDCRPGTSAGLEGEPGSKNLVHTTTTGSGKPQTSLTLLHKEVPQRTGGLHDPRSSDHHSPPLQLTCHDDSLTDDMFVSPFASLSHSSHCLQPSTSSSGATSTKSVTTGQSCAVTVSEKFNEHTRKHALLEDGEEVEKENRQFRGKEEDRRFGERNDRQFGEKEQRLFRDKDAERKYRQWEHTRASVEREELPQLLPQDNDAVMESACGSGSDSERDESAELIAASNYERVAYIEDGVAMDSSSAGDSSFQELMGSGRSCGSGGGGGGAVAGASPLVCGDRDPEEERAAMDLLQKDAAAWQWQDSPGGGVGGGLQGRGRPTEAQAGQDRVSFSPSGCSIQEYLDIAADMSDSFTSTSAISPAVCATATATAASAGAQCPVAARDKGPAVRAEAKCSNAVRTETKCSNAVRAEVKCSNAVRAEVKCSNAVRTEAKCSNAVRTEAKCSNAVRAEAKCSNAVRAEAKCSNAVRTEATGVGLRTGCPQSQQSDAGGGGGGGVDDFSTSFTMSMMEKAFSEESFAEPPSLEAFHQKERQPEEGQCLEDRNVTESEKGRDKEKARGERLAAVKQSPSDQRESVCAQESAKRKQSRAMENCGRKAESSSHAQDNAAGTKDVEENGVSKEREDKSSPRSSEEFVPPTPPEEGCSSVSSVSSPRGCVRRTPLRACRARAEAHQHNHPQGAPVLPQTKNRSKGKNSAHTKHGQSTGDKKKGVSEHAQSSKSQRGKENNTHTSRKSVNAKHNAYISGVKEIVKATHKPPSPPERSLSKTKESSNCSSLGSSNCPSSSKTTPLNATPQKNADHVKKDADHESSDERSAKEARPLGDDDDDDGETERDMIANTCSEPLIQDHTSVEQDMAVDVDMDSPPPSQDSLCIIDVCSNARLFDMFSKEWRSQTHYSISLACERKPVSAHGTGVGIGSNFIMQGKGMSRGQEAMTVRGAQGGVVIPGGEEDTLIVGLAVSWTANDAYFISFTPNHSNDDDDHDEAADDTLAAPPSTQSICQGQVIELVREVLDQTQRKGTQHRVVVCDSKATYTALMRGLGLGFGRCRDPLVACWLLDPGAKEKTVHGMVTNFTPADLPLMEGVGGIAGYGSLGLCTESRVSGRLRAVTESLVGRRLMDQLWAQLREAGLTSAFTGTEMPSVLTLARMELNGFGFSEEECERQKELMLGRLSALEQEAYALAGHPFSLTAPDDIAQVLYLELRLPVNGDPSAPKPQVRTLGPSRRAPRGGGGRGLKSSLSTCKEVLEKLKAFHPLPAIVLEWRRISCALTKQVFPLQQAKVPVAALGMKRIFSVSQLHTATGRVSMTEPNLQNVPRDFDIALPDVIGESPPALPHAMTSLTAHRKGPGAGTNSRLEKMRGLTPQKARVSNPATATHASVSMRHAFVPFSGAVILAADYSQLELRVIAHLSGDSKLISVLNNDGDVFKLIAAQWKNTLPEAVTAQERQHAKQICYGMLYGIGPRALGEQIGVDENDATVFMESFKAKYTGMRRYLRQTVEQCRQDGYVSTLTGRRRYLPAIKDPNPHAKAQAERQAVNTTVQGSAADIVKAAMNAVDAQLALTFPDTRLPHTHPHADGGRRRGAFLLLQLHDELIYEVSEPHLPQVVNIVRQCMEHTTPLSVPLPVKVRAGPSWGSLTDMQL